jgi:hypothetical protein
MISWILYLNTGLLLGVIFLLLIILFILLKKKIVTVPSLTMVLTPVTPPGQYDHGATVNVTGVDLLDVGKPAAGDTVTLNLTDSSGAEFNGVASVQTAQDGSYAASFVVPNTVAPGQATLEATDAKTGATATATFTLSRMKPIHH